MKSLHILLLCLASFTLHAQQADLDRPFGWANCTSLTSGDDYQVTGGNAVTHPCQITLVSHGGDMRQDIIDALSTHDIVVLDGRMGDFMVSSSMRFEGLHDKTIVGINNARVCTRFFLNEEIHRLMNERHVLDAVTSGNGTAYTLSNGRNVHEEREYIVRQLLIDHLDDPDETYRDAGLFNLNDCHNLVMRNLTLVGPGAIDVGGADLLTCSRGSDHLWIDHCDFVDGMDGNFDINSFSDLITVSWCRFHYTERTYIHANTNLVGSSDRASSNGEDNLNITFAFCEWGPGCDQRMPMARFGTIHLLNNYYNCAGNSAAINPRFHAQFRIEGNYFERGVTRIFSQRDPLSYVFVDNYYSEPFEQPADLGQTPLPYSYKAIPVDQVAVTVGRKAGATLSDPLSFYPLTD